MSRSTKARAALALAVHPKTPPEEARTAFTSAVELARAEGLTITLSGAQAMTAPPPRQDDEAIASLRRQIDRLERELRYERQTVDAHERELRTARRTVEQAREAYDKARAYVERAQVLYSAEQAKSGELQRRVDALESELAAAREAAERAEREAEDAKSAHKSLLDAALKSLRKVA